MYNHVMSTKKTRDLLMEYLTTHPPATSRELARELGVCAADIRYHLAILQRESIVETIQTVPQGSILRGRPGRYFRLATDHQPDNYQALASALLLIARSTPASSAVPLEKALAEQLSAHHPVVKNLPRRLTNAIVYLNRKHYDASWEARSQGPCIVFRNCPYAAIWPEFPTLCGMDANLLENLVALPVKMIGTTHDNPGRHSACIFQVINVSGHPENPASAS